MDYLEELGYIGIWKSNQDHESDRFSWYHPTGKGFRIDYIIVSAMRGASFMTYMDFKILN